MKKLIAFFTIVFILGCAVKGGAETMKEMEGKKILMVVAPENFRDEELFKPEKYFKSMGAKVTIASKGVENAKGMLGSEVMIDIDISAVKLADYDAVIFVGGSGAAMYFDDEVVLSLARDFHSSNKLVGAICIAPSILANAGVLESRMATSFESEQSNLESKGAVYTGNEVTVDGNVVTANGPAASQEFAETMTQLIISSPA